MSAINDDLHVNGTLSALVFKAPVGSITDAAVIGAAGIQYTKLQQRRTVQHSQPNTSATSETKVAGAVVGATGTLVAIQAGCIGPCVGSDTVTIDVRVNGVSVLTGVITLNSSQAAYALVSGSFATTALTMGNVLTIVVTPNHTTGTLGTGVFAILTWAEDPQ